MANLAIKGHKTRGKEVIEILEMLGGTNRENCWGVFENRLYLINSFGDIEDRSLRDNSNYQIYTLEEFLEKSPYKVGDKVSSKYLKNYKIEKMEWEDTNNRVIYKLQGMGWYAVNELQPYKEETMETITIDDFKANTKEWLIDKLHGMIISDAVKTIGNIHDELHKSKYPKTYEECARLLDTFCGSIEGYGCKLLPYLQQLLICRDAYWKIAGEQMGLGKPWKPNLQDKKEPKYVITNLGGNIAFELYAEYNAILAFPTVEMRDAFYESFKDLIEQCKELL